MTHADGHASTEAAPRRFRVPVARLIITTLVALLMFAYRYFNDLASGDPPRPLQRLIEEGTGVFMLSLLFPFVRGVARRFPLRRDSWLTTLPVHAGAALLFGVTGTTLFWLSRTAIFWLVGLGRYDYGVIALRYPMELSIQVIVYALFASSVWLFDRSQAQRESALREARLETQLKQAQLHGLRLQLQPHFLFNALNTISSTMYDDPAAADTMLSRLAELLRVSLRTTQAQEVPLAAELEALDHYVALLRARFGDRLALRVEVDAAVRQALVPSLILQPLVENAVRHGNLSTVGRGRVDVTARQAGDRLRVEVDDDGPGIVMEAGVETASKGIGLSATRERLRLLYGDAQRLTLDTRPAGGFQVAFELPLRLADGSGDFSASVTTGTAATAPTATASATPATTHAAGERSYARADR
jgi:signal transduction histidine kinase